MKIYGCFLIFGADVEPQVRMLNDFASLQLGRALVNADDSAVSDDERKRVYAKYFQPGVEWAVPCWLEAPLLAVVADESLEKKVRVIAARIYEGLPYSAGRDLLEGPEQGKDDDNGAKADIRPVRPKPRKPPGGARVTPQLEAVTS